MRTHTEIEIVSTNIGNGKAIAMTFVAKGEDGVTFAVSPTAYMTREEGKHLSRILDEVADAVPREMVEGDL